MAASKTRRPIATPGLRVGLLAGSFNPAHGGHRAISLYALKRLGLDRIWWLVSARNPLKNARELAPLERRLDRAKALARHPRIDVTALEAEFGTVYSRDTMAELRRRYPHLRFVFLIGADNLAGLHRWRRWRELTRLVPIAVIDRGGTGANALARPAPLALSQNRIGERHMARLAARRPPAWTFLHGIKSPLSSTALRTTAAKG